MNLLQIDDLVLSDLDIGTASPVPLITSGSERLRYGTRRREGEGTSVYQRGHAEPALWSVVIWCPDLAAHDAVLAVLTRDVTRERRLLARRLDAAQTRVVTHAAIVSVDELNEFDLAVTLESAASEWVAESAVSTTKSFTSTLDRLIRLAVPGNTTARPVIRLTPQTQRSTFSVNAGWRFRRRATITNNSDVPWFRYPVRLPAIDGAALVTAGKAQADGDDVRVWLAGVEQPRTVLDWNTTTADIWVIVPALPAGESLVYDVVYGNSAATNPPALLYPDLPAFDLATSTNAAWAYAFTAGKGLWHLSQSTIPATPDFDVPGAWRPVTTITDPDRPDGAYVVPWKFGASGSSAIAGFEGRREQHNLDSVNMVYYENGYDGVELYSPLPIESITANWFIDNPNQAAALVYLERRSAADDWELFYINTSVGPTTITPGAQSLDAGTFRHLTCAMWPVVPTTTSPQRFIAGDNINNSIVLRTPDTSPVFSLAIDDTDLSISLGSEEEIYEIASEVRLFGGEERVAPYQAIVVGNARQELGAGTPRAACTLTQAVVVDTENHRADVWNESAGLLTTLAEEVPAHAVMGLAGYWDGDSSAEAPGNDWLPVELPRTEVPNGTFDTDITGWSGAGETAGITVTRSQNGAVGGAALGAYRFNITANTAGANAVADTISDAAFPLNGRAAITLGAWMLSASANLVPRLGVRWERADGSDLTPDAFSALFTPVAAAEVERGFAARAPANATQFRLLLRVQDTVGGTTGDVQFDDITIDGADLWFADEAQGTADVDVRVDLAGRFL